MTDEHTLLAVLPGYLDHSFSKLAEMVFVAVLSHPVERDTLPITEFPIEHRRWDDIEFPLVEIQGVDQVLFFGCDDAKYVNV